jgi:hypothetical protein
MVRKATNHPTGCSIHKHNVCAAAGNKGTHSDEISMSSGKSTGPFQHFNNQLTHTTLKNVELLKHFKISKTAPTCFGLQGNHHQGAKIRT